MKKHIVILENNHGRLANQLWCFISVFAYCKERGYKLSNYCFQEYQDFFRIRIENVFMRFFLYVSSRKNKINMKLRLYRMYVNFIKRFDLTKIITDDNLNQFYLPPSNFRTKEDEEKIHSFEESKDSTLYLRGWMFRNPVGIEKYRKEIFSYFKPIEKIEKSITQTVEMLRKNTSHIVGVHIRQDDYTTFLGGTLFFTEVEVRKILDEYLAFKNLAPKEVTFVICSDDTIHQDTFSGLTTYLSKGNAIEDLFLLASTDCIIGSNSTFGAFASYYGNIPFIVFERPVVNWDYYRNKSTFFENEKSTLVFY